MSRRTRLPHERRDVRSFEVAQMLAAWKELEVEQRDSALWQLPQLRTFDFWFQPRHFESEHLYKRLGALVLKRYVPTGGDLVMHRLRRRHPDCKWVTSGLQSLCLYERRTRVNELIHLIGFIGCMVVVVGKFATGSLTAVWLTVASVLNLIFGLWPVVLQRYNRLRLYRCIDTYSRLMHRS